VCACVCVCVCVRERERECVCVYVRTYVQACVCRDSVCGVDDGPIRKRDEFSNFKLDELI